jgi:hypothetical protein
LSSRGESCSAAEQDTSDNSDKLLESSSSGRTAHQLPQPPESEDYVNNNKENGGFHPANWLLGGQPSQRHVSAASLHRRHGGSEEEEEEEGAASGRDSEESEEDKYGSSSPRLLLDRDLNMNRGSSSCDPTTTAPKGVLSTPSGGYDLAAQPPHPLVDQLRAVTERIGQLVSEAGRTDNPRTLQDLAVLQTTLFSLQQQQLLQMQILSHMQNQMKTSGDGTSGPAPRLPTHRHDEQQQQSTANNSGSHRLLLTQQQQQQHEEEIIRKERRRREEEEVRRGREANQQQQQQPPLRKLQDLIGPDRTAKSGAHHSNSPVSSSNPGYAGHNSGSLSHSSATIEETPSSVASGFFAGDRQPPPPFSASILAPGDQSDHASSPLNSLELLQQKAQGILNNASHGLLKNSLADLSYSKSAAKDDPHFKHRCKFCGKVFGSDSALQIHIRFDSWCLLPLRFLTFIS